MGKSDLKSVKVERPVEKIPLSSSVEDDSPIRAIFCLKRNEDMKRFEEKEDCFILEFDPFEPVNLSKLSLKKPSPVDDEAADLSVIGEKGQCYCYVCDSAAPCKYWTQPNAAHCDAENVDFWKAKRNMNKNNHGFEVKIPLV